MPEPEICFVICPIGDDDTDIRKRSDIALKEIISPVVSPFGYEIRRADNISHPGLITNQIIDMLAEAPLVIADLSDGNPNVFYELAIRHITGLPCIQLIQMGQKVPFDTSGMRTIQYDLRVDLAHKAMDELKQQISSVKEGTYKPDNPILSAKRYEAIKRKILSTDDSELRELFTELMDSMKSSMDEMKVEIGELKQTNPQIYSDISTNSDVLFIDLGKLNPSSISQRAGRMSRLCKHDRINVCKREIARCLKELETNPSLSNIERITLTERMINLQAYLEELTNEDSEES
ncbi:hypothetical protein [Methanoculleus sp.]|jgi:hypothetical protein|uniref:hypothetical protein n=1 Tax=Methanoculleus sp. TaxID=90427 RepID=UPI001BD34671|nr:hypothetical protein [Methanoculleus sp.]